MKTFDYLPIGPQLKLIMQSTLFCYELLAMWRDNSTWVGKNTEDIVFPIKNFRDGSKVRLNQDFWNLASKWELPVICPSCRASH
jgi:hypothetical protein